MILAIVITAIIFGSFGFLAGAVWASRPKYFKPVDIRPLPTLREYQAIGRLIRNVEPTAKPTRRERRALAQRRADLNAALVGRPPLRKPN